MGVIHEAARSGDIDGAERVLERTPSAVNADDEHGWRPLCHAAYMGREEMVKLLLDWGANVAAHDGQAVHFAAESTANRPCLELLLQAGGLDALVRPHCALTRQFFHAIYMGNTARTGRLLDRDPDMLNAPDGRGFPPLYHAAVMGDAEMCRMLVERGAEVDAPASDCRTPLFGAAAHGHLDAARVLLSAPAQGDRRQRNILDILRWAQVTVPNDRERTGIVALLSEHLE